jgi:hypothetical protein
MTPDLLREVGEALYGPRWQSDLAADLGVTDRTVRRWAAGSTPMPDGVIDDLRATVKSRTGDLAKILKRL